MTSSAAERAATSRHNGQNSKGPRTPEGKDRSRFNALKHGLKSKVVVLPGEDAQEFQGRLDAWIDDWQPANDVERSLVERAVTLTWQLDRAERAGAARLATVLRAAPAEQACRQEDEARALGQYRRRLEGRRVDELRPQDPAGARATLRAIIEKAVIRLEAKREVHAAHAALEAATLVDRLCFDDSAEGERLRRFQLAGQRALLRTVDSLMKLRRQEPMGPAVSHPVKPAGTGALGDGLSVTIWCGPEGTDSCFGSDVLLAVPDLFAGPFSPPVPPPHAQNESNEPTSGRDDPPHPPAEAIAAQDEYPISPNEPTAPAVDHPILAEEPSIPAEDPRPQPQPARRRCGDSPPSASAPAMSEPIHFPTDPAPALPRSTHREVDRRDDAATGPEGPLTPTT